MARITLDLEELVSSGRLTAVEAERLSAMAVPGRGVSSLIQALYILGALGLAAGVVALKPDASTGLFLALVALGFAVWVKQTRNEGLSILGTGMAIAGTFGIIGWLALQFGDTLPGVVLHGLATLALVGAALAFDSLFIAAFVPIGLGAMVGSGTAYWHASYGVFVREATVTVLLFAALSVVLFRLGRSLAGIRGHMATVAGRMSWVMMNLGFWVGSLWGDAPGAYLVKSWSGQELTWRDEMAWREAGHLFIPDYVFVVAWAAVSIVTILIAKNNRFALNAAITFLAINAYTQFFERFGDSALALLTGGVTLMAFAFGLYHFDRWAMSRRGQA